MQRSRLIAAWIAATTLAMFLVGQAIGVIADSVTDRPSAIRIASDGIPEPSGPPDPVPVASLHEISDVGAPATDLAEIDVEKEALPTTAPPLPVTAAPSTAPPPSAPSAPTFDDVQRITLAAGSLTLACADGDISVGAATPAPGWTMNIKEAGPEQARVDFETDSGNEMRVEANCEEGLVDYEIDGED